MTSLENSSKRWLRPEQRAEFGWLNAQGGIPDSLGVAVLINKAQYGYVYTLVEAFTWKSFGA